LATRPARPLPLTLVASGRVEIAAPPGAGQPSLALRAASCPAHALRVARRRRGRERPAALGASSWRRHAPASPPHSPWPPSWLAGRRWITNAPRRPSSARGAVDHERAAKWITGRAPLKRPGPTPRRAPVRRRPAGLTPRRRQSRARARLNEEFPSQG